MENLVISVEQFVHNLNDWVIVAEATRIRIHAQFIWNINFLTLFKLEYEQFLLELDFPKSCLNEPDITESTNTKHELGFSELRAHLHSLELHLKLYSIGSLLIHI